MSNDVMREVLEDLAVPHRARDAYWRLLVLGSSALDTARAGLSSPNALVRVYCTLALDRLADDDAYDDLVSVLDDPEPRVRLHALHALACDRCKADDVCVPTKDDVLPLAIRRLATDEHPHVRAMAVEVVGRWVHDDERAVDALVSAQRDDPSPAVRKKAGWYAPGGTIHRRTAPKPTRARAR